MGAWMIAAYTKWVRLPSVIARDGITSLLLSFGCGGLALVDRWFFLTYLDGL